MKKTVYLTSKQDGLKLHVLLMEPEQSPKGIVQICHGMRRLCEIMQEIAW